MTKLKLSQLADDVEVSNDGSLSILTAGELKDEIARFGNEQTGQWFTVKPKKWQADARHMIEVYIENQEVEMYEDWDERAMDCVSEDLLKKMQNLLDEAFRGDKRFIGNGTNHLRLILHKLNNAHSDNNAAHHLELSRKI